MFGFGLSWLLDWASPGPGMEGIPQGMSFEHDVYCCLVFALVSVSGCSGGSMASAVCSIILSVLQGTPGLLLHAARFTTGYVRLVGQEPAPSKCVLVSTSRVVRSDMRGWVVTDEGHRWSVKLDVRDLGGHLDTTLHGWSSTLASRVRSCHFSVGSCLCSSVGFSWAAPGYFVPCLFLVLCMVLKLLFLLALACGS